VSSANLDLVRSLRGLGTRRLELCRVGDDRVVGLFHQRATGKGSGLPVELHMALVYELEDGRVNRIRNLLDPAEALEAVGPRE
jgi:ketosteroid isomerase-like protein